MSMEDRNKIAITVAIIVLYAAPMIMKLAEWIVKL
jgi:hypothetical protein